MENGTWNNEDSLWKLLRQVLSLQSQPSTYKPTLASITKLPIQQYHLCRLDFVQLAVRGLDVEIQGNRQSRKFKAPDFVESHSNRTTS